MTDEPHTEIECKEPPSSLEKGRDLILSYVKALDLSPGVYRMIDDQGKILYVGKAKHLKNRVRSYTQIEKLPNRLKRMVSQTVEMAFSKTHTETEALLLESNLIKKYRPPFNILLKDDKSYPFVLLTDHDYPRLQKYRGRQNSKGQYFGPFASAMAVDETIEIMQKVFKIRNCRDSYFNNRQRPCLQYFIKRCSAPCVHKISKDDYQNSVKEAVLFLKGKSTTLQKDLSEKMSLASEQRLYEKAIEYRDQIKLLTQLQSRQSINAASMRDTDVLALIEKGGWVCVHLLIYRHSRNYGSESFYFKKREGVNLPQIIQAFLMQFYGAHEIPPKILLNIAPSDFDLVQKIWPDTDMILPKSKDHQTILKRCIDNADHALTLKLSQDQSNDKIFKRLQDLADLSDKPKRIETYDNSHIQGSDPYGVMVVATPQGFDKASYRKFKIRQNPVAFGGDDFYMMSEVMKRRFNIDKIQDTVLPDLLLIDGGKGQLSSVHKMMRDLNLDIPLIGIAKGENRHAYEETLHFIDKDPIKLDKNDPLLCYLQTLRDEAHRFAINAHRSGRSQKIQKSRLDSIPGIGPKRKKLLLQHFGSSQEVMNAGIEDLKAVEGISDKVATQLYNTFRDK